MNIFELYNQFRQNPMSMLQQRYNIPAELNNPNDILQHLVKTGQVSQDQINMVMSMSKMIKGL